MSISIVVVLKNIDMAKYAVGTCFEKNAIPISIGTKNQ